ncbi:Choline transport system permease protein OpuBB [Acidipropionibacterium virtanenii]|uniref:Choline transport system permease protein OpuBB n=2 Tax=Acidipropionibacterium virtanenii TaxID=2057246 RepID=A0A344UQT1_9ACTN|nr:Choline transport system permease protein OpuBB [Acidipropionibacterium virtanenii]
MNLLWEWLADPVNWAGPDGVWARVAEHLVYSGIALLIAAAIGVPLGLWIGHTGRGRVVTVNLVNGMRAVPTLGLLFAAVLVIGPRLHGDSAFQVPAVLVLVILAAPPILAGTYSGIDAVPADARDAARGMGMTPGQVLARVEVPCALPLIFSGVRSAALQVIATAILAAYVGLGGLGYFLQLGLGSRDYGMMAGGAVLVALLALAVDLLLAWAQRLTLSPGLRTHDQAG